MSFSSAKRRRIKPFARPTSFDINVAYDIRHFQRIKYGNIVKPYFPAVGTDEAFQVMEGEILMQNKNNSVRRYGDHQMHVFSFANGLSAGGKNLNAGSSEASQPEKAAVLQNLKYAGVAVTGFQPEKDIFEQGFVMTMAGLNTLFNNGAHTLYPGELICADIPNPADSKRNRSLQTGVPHDKLQFVVTPFSQLAEDLGTKDNPNTELASAFIMGTALSYSRAGQPVDVVLHKTNVICSRARAESSMARSESSISSSSSGSKKKKGK